MNPITETLLSVQELDPDARMSIGVTTSYTTHPFTDVLYVAIFRHGRVIEDCGQWGDLGLYLSKETRDAYVFGPIDADPAALARQLITALQGAPEVAA